MVVAIRLFDRSELTQATLRLKQAFVCSENLGREQTHIEQEQLRGGCHSDAIVQLHFSHSYFDLLGYLVLRIICNVYAVIYLDWSGVDLGVRSTPSTNQINSL